MPSKNALLPQPCTARIGNTLRAALGLSLACVLPAFAQNASDGHSRSTWSLGLGVASTQTPYTGEDRENRLLPIVRYENQYIHIAGTHLGLKLPSLDISDSQKINFSLVASYDGSGYKSSDAPILNGMDKRKGGIWAGAEIEWQNPLLDITATWQADASSNSKGQQLSLGIERSWRLGQHFTLTPRLQANWQDKKYVDYYFGVREHEVRAGRAGYSGKSGTSVELGLHGLYRLDQHHAIMMSVSVTSLASSIKDSPLVDRSSDNRVFIGYLYHFR